MKVLCDVALRIIGGACLTEQGVSPMALEGKKVGEFWDSLYSGAKRDRPDDDDASDADGAVGSATKAYADWIMAPADVVSGLPPALQARLRLPAGSPHRVLELGCGTSGLALALTKVFPLVEVVAVDISPAAIDSAEAHRRTSLTLAEETGDADVMCALRRVRFAIGDVTALPPDLCPSGAFAAAFDKGTSDTLRFRARRRGRDGLVGDMFREVGRCLVGESAGDLAGYFCVVTPRKRVPGLHGHVCDDFGVLPNFRLVGCARTSHGIGGNAEDCATVGDPRPASYIHIATIAAEPVPKAVPLPQVPTSTLPAVCAVCGRARKPRYKTERSWRRHLELCVPVPARGPPLT